MKPDLDKLNAPPSTASPTPAPSVTTPASSPSPPARSTPPDTSTPSTPPAPSSTYHPGMKNAVAATRRQIHPPPQSTGACPTKHSGCTSTYYAKPPNGSPTGEYRPTSPDGQRSSASWKRPGSGTETAPAGYFHDWSGLQPDSRRSHHEPQPIQGWEVHRRQHRHHRRWHAARGAAHRLPLSAKRRPTPSDRIGTESTRITEITTESLPNRYRYRYRIAPYPNPKPWSPPSLTPPPVVLTF